MEFQEFLRQIGEGFWAVGIMGLSKTRLHYTSQHCLNLGYLSWLVFTMLNCFGICYYDGDGVNLFDV